MLIRRKTAELWRSLFETHVTGLHDFRLLASGTYVDLKSPEDGQSLEFSVSRRSVQQLIVSLNPGSQYLSTLLLLEFVAD